VAKGSLLNKAILVPAALAISAVAPWLVTPLLMVGGAYLCFEGAEKLAHRFLHSRAEDEAEHAGLTQALVAGSVDLVAFEKDKIKGAVRTDFVLSAEIIAITLGSVAGQALATQASVLALVAVVMTIGVYGIVAGIVKLDDLGLALARRRGALARRLGGLLVAAAPGLMRALAVLGTVAMFLVGGGILAHGWPLLGHAIEAQAGALVPAAHALLGVAAGLLVMLAVLGVGRLRRRLSDKG
jgi:predicted DNA repair protein MutK